LKIDRRTFIQISAPLVAAASALAGLPSLPRRATWSQLVVSKTDLKGVVFKIAGWDRCQDVASDCSKTSSAGFMTSDSIGDEVFISVNQSWHTAWR
jgi:hypothetical protein